MNLACVFTPIVIRNAAELLNNEETAFFENIVRSSEIQKVRHALYGALLFSPLYLLVPLKISNNAWDQEKMVKVRTGEHVMLGSIAQCHPLQLSKALGNRKPPMLVKIERLLWECLLQISTGKDTCYNALNKFFHEVDWDEIAMISEDDRGHFADGVLCCFVSMELNPESTRHFFAGCQYASPVYRRRDRFKSLMDFGVIATQKYCCKCRPLR